MDKKINLKEQRKLENYEHIRNQMTEEGFIEKQAIISGLLFYYSEEQFF